MSYSIHKNARPLGILFSQKSCPQVDDALDFLSEIGAMFTDNDNNNGDDDEEMDDEGDDLDNDRKGETAADMKSRIRNEQARQRAEEKAARKMKQKTKRAQHALDKGSTKGLKSMEGTVNQIRSDLLSSEDCANILRGYRRAVLESLSVVLMQVIARFPLYTWPKATACIP